MIHPVEPDKLYVPSCGDVLWGAVPDDIDPTQVCFSTAEDNMTYSGLLLGELDGKEQRKQVLQLVWLHLNTVRALEKLPLDPMPILNSEYDCPYTGHKCYGVVPVALISNDISKYRPHLTKQHVNFLDAALDYRFTRDMYMKKGDRSYHEADLAFAPGKIAKQLLGPGYTYCCSANDGHGATKLARIKYDNGDFLIVWFWEWYNK